MEVAREGRLGDSHTGLPQQVTQLLLAGNSLVANEIENRGVTLCFHHLDVLVAKAGGVG